MQKKNQEDFSTPLQGDLQDMLREKKQISAQGSEFATLYIYVYMKKREVNKYILSLYFQEETMGKKPDRGEFLSGKEENKVKEQNRTRLLSIHLIWNHTKILHNFKKIKLKR